MPLFTPTQHTIQAWQWRGNLADLPLVAARHVETRGWQPPLVRTADGIRVAMPEGSWLVLGVDGRVEVMPDGVFQHRFEPVPTMPTPTDDTIILSKGKRNAH